MKETPRLYGTKDAVAFLNISQTRFYELMKNYGIPHQQTSAGRIFFEEDLIRFQESRKEKLKHSRNLK